jgi:uncharacterized protein (TIGR00730 family)
MSDLKINEEEMSQHIHDLISSCGFDPTTFQADLVGQMIQNSLKMMVDGHDIGQLKLMSRAMKEMRYAYRIFNKHKGSRCISIFGSARTPEDHPDYLAAKEFSAKISHLGWSCMTGAANGIMKAGLEGPEPGAAFGLSIRLPFESTINSVIEGDPKLITFRYFFTRKLMFMSHSDAAAIFPGGVGTLDELFEFLTLMQTGKANIIPIVLLEGQNGGYWDGWEEYIKDHLLGNGWISEADQSFYHKASSIEEAIAHVQKFYSRFHSYRYVNDLMVIRMTTTLAAEQLEQLNRQFPELLKSGKYGQSEALPEEDDHLELPRLVFEHTRRDFGIVRRLIDQINRF